MQDAMLPGRSPGRIAIVVLLIIQCILGLLFSLPFLAYLLAPGRPVIVTGTSIFTGPIAGAALGVALASYKYRFFTPGRGHVPVLGVFVVCDGPFPCAFSSCSQLKACAVSEAR